ncbi:hypothetical protein CsSME_00040202 [Camellia sinensis var. sinensis]
MTQVPYITTALMDAKLGTERRKNLFDWLSRQLSGLNNFPDAINLLKPTASAMTDKSADVHKAAEVCIGEIFRVCGPDAVCRQKFLVPPLVFVKNLAELLRPALAIVLERLKHSGAFQVDQKLGKMDQKFTNQTSTLPNIFLNKFTKLNCTRLLGSMSIFGRIKYFWMDVYG